VESSIKKVEIAEKARKIQEKAQSEKGAAAECAQKLRSTFPVKVRAGKHGPLVATILGGTVTAADSSSSIAASKITGSDATAITEALGLPAASGSTGAGGASGSTGAGGASGSTGAGGASGSTVRDWSDFENPNTDGMYSRHKRTITDRQFDEMVAKLTAYRNLARYTREGEEVLMEGTWPVQPYAVIVEWKAAGFEYFVQCLEEEEESDEEGNTSSVYHIPMSLFNRLRTVTGPAAAPAAAAPAVAPPAAVPAAPTPAPSAHSANNGKGTSKGRLLSGMQRLRTNKRQKRSCDLLEPDHDETDEQKIDAMDVDSGEETAPYESGSDEETPLLLRK
jgi:hypothetical protein